MCCPERKFPAKQGQVSRAGFPQVSTPKTCQVSGKKCQIPKEWAKFPTKNTKFPPKGSSFLFQNASGFPKKLLETFAQGKILWGAFGKPAYPGKETKPEKTGSGLRAWCGWGTLRRCPWGPRCARDRARRASASGGRSGCGGSACEASAARKKRHGLHRIPSCVTAPGRHSAAADVSSYRGSGCARAGRPRAGRMRPG